MSAHIFEKLSGQTRRRVTIVNYGVGNLGSLSGSFSRLGYTVHIANKPGDLDSSDAVILPGVGAMPFAIERLRKTGLDKAVADCVARTDIPVIGICLGMQLMFDHSEEGDCEGLGLLSGRVRRFPDGACHVGWNLCETPVNPNADGSWSRAAMYFNHSYFVDADPLIVKSTANLPGFGDVITMVQSGSFTGIQCHPEKSQVAGAELLRHLIGGPSSAIHPLNSKSEREAAHA